MDDFPVRMNQLQELLDDIVVDMSDRRRKSGRRSKVSDEALSRELGVNSATVNSWLNGRRLPSYKNAVVLSRHKRIGMKIFDILGFDKPDVGVVHDARLAAVIDNWGDLGRSNPDAQGELFKGFTEAMNGRKIRFYADNGGEEPPDDG